MTTGKKAKHNTIYKNRDTFKLNNLSDGIQNTLLANPISTIAFEWLNNERRVLISTLSGCTVVFEIALNSLKGRDENNF